LHQPGFPIGRNNRPSKHTESEKQGNGSKGPCEITKIALLRFGSRLYAGCSWFQIFIHCSAKHLTISLNTSRAVLVVDDSVAIRSIVVDILRQHGYTVYEAESGDTALTEWQLHKDEIGVVLSDVVMPGGTDGITLARHLRKRSPNLSIVLLSSHINEDTQWVTEEANFSFLPKPFESTQLLETVRSILG
jgi:CheY-like chemotaxis protein